jgi:hypothetical protein
VLALVAATVTPLAADDKALEMLPGEHYFETGGRQAVADLLEAWITERT